MGLFDVTLVHIGGERKVMAVESVAPNGGSLAVYWGLSGFYDLNLRTNWLTSRSAAARRKAECYWRADDILAVRKAVTEYLEGQKDNGQKDRAGAIARHKDTMPR